MIMLTQPELQTSNVRRQTIIRYSEKIRKLGWLSILLNYHLTKLLNMSNHQGCAIMYVRNWVQFCSALFPEVLGQKWSGYRLLSKVPYTLYQMEKTPTVYMVAFGTPFLLNCEVLEFRDDLSIKCITRMSLEFIVYFARSQIECVDHTFALTNDLLASCLDSKFDVGKMHDYSMDFINKYYNNFTVMLYIEHRENPTAKIFTNKCSNFDFNIWLILFVAIYLFIVIFRKKFL